MKLKELIANSNFDINCHYQIYNGTWDNGGERLWDSLKDGKVCEDDIYANDTVTYVTIHDNVLIIEIA